MPKKVWLVEMPTRLYVEDVKSLARKHTLTLIDARFANDFTKDEIEENPPKLTLVCDNSESPPNDEERQLRDEYERLYGKKAGGRMSIETLRKKVNEASE